MKMSYNGGMDKTRRFLIIAIRCCFVILALLFFVLILVDPNYHKWGGVLAGLGLPFLPPIIERVFKSKISFRIQLLYYIFLFIALDLGICMDMYKSVPYFDKVVHFGSGVISTIVGYYAIVHYSATKTSPVFRSLVIIGISMMIAVAWEFFEFGCDKFLGQNMQQLVSVGVDDTMFDLLSATLGSIIGALLFTNKKFIKSLEK